MRVQACGWGVCSWFGDDIATLDVFFVQSVDVYGGAVTGSDFFGACVCGFADRVCARVFHRAYRQFHRRWQSCRPKVCR